MCLASTPKQSPRTFRPSSPKPHELNQLYNGIIVMAKSMDTVSLLKGASLQEKRGIVRLSLDVPLNGALMEWATVLLKNAVVLGDAPFSVHMWKNAFLFIWETLKSLGYGPESKQEAFFKAGQKIFHFVGARYLAVVQEAKRFLAVRPLPFFFKGFLCFASHYAKHGVCLGITPTEYLKKAEELFRLRSFQENGCRVWKKHGWTVYVETRPDGTYIKTLHLKASWH
ncbi:hypothetical protein QR680_019172 [Steinernema hermaphroditum]|uniref:Uncharacterized protein n=1 Tax=Steinernema hermaphroditum TaxID=289476 RepID=A0AA39LS85_9BILA|nr:hypothetical protein QR680_019172 [Steinernema hermaphroditum]